MRKAKKIKPYTSLLLSSLENKENILENIISSEINFKPREINKPIVIYGAGELGKMAKELFDHLNIKILYVLDKNSAFRKKEKYWKNIKIINPKNVKNKDKRTCLLVVCVAVSPLIKLRDQLKKDGWKDIIFFYDIAEFYRDSYPITNGWFLDKLKEKEKKNIKKVFSLLADNESKNNYLQFIAWHKLRAELLFKGLTKNKDNRFFPKEITNILHNNEFFVDAGAHKGSVVEKFIQATDRKYKSIYAIEPDRNSLEILENKLKNVSNVKIIKKALGNRNKEGTFFQGFNFISKLSKNGNSLVRAVTLDSLKINATFIKMHLEGGELNALKGSANTIKKHRSIIAVTIYHNSDGAWGIPLFLMNNTKNYKYYIRSDSWGGTGVVFYAIPKERYKKVYYGN